MRSRGAKIADIALIVVAIDDGVQPQTREAIRFALKEKLPMIVALNKIDLPGESESKIKSQLAGEGVVTEDMGGDTILVKTSTKTKVGIDELLERIILLTQIHDMKEKKIDEEGLLADGIVLESNLNKNLGAVALVVLKRGKISSKDLYIANEKFSSKVRAVLNHEQKQVDEVEAGDPIWITGLTNVLDIGLNVKIFGDKTLAEAQVASMQEAAEVDLSSTRLRYFRNHSYSKERFYFLIAL
jgi:translation initiation factor IF-2